MIYGIYTSSYTYACANIHEYVNIRKVNTTTCTRLLMFMLECQTTAFDMEALALTESVRHFKRDNILPRTKVI